MYTVKIMNIKLIYYQSSVSSSMWCKIHYPTYGWSTWSFYLSQRHSIIRNTLVGLNNIPKSSPLTYAPVYLLALAFSFLIYDAAIFFKFRTRRVFLCTSIIQSCWRDPRRQHRSYRFVEVSQGDELEWLCGRGLGQTRGVKLLKRRRVVCWFFTHLIFDIFADPRE